MRYKILALLLACTALTACIDDDLETCIDDENEIPEIFTDGYALNLKVTLDNMGGTRAVEGAGREAELQMLESYIDPEKFRVLFFDREDRFLFESKSRWVKRISESADNDYSQWFVSVPIYAYGNDEKEDWNWEQIRRVLTGEDVDDVDANGKAIYTDKTKTGDVAFKIAILANRPKREWNMGINGRYTDGSTSIDFRELIKDKDGNVTGYGDATDVITEGGYVIENGPNWSTTDTRWGSGDAKTIQTDDDKIIRVYDLHHCQYDPIYDGKNWEGYGRQSDYDGSYGKTDKLHSYHSTYACYKSEREYDYSTAEKIGDHYYANYDFYGFASGKTLHKGEYRPTMGATSTWVDWGDSDNNKVTIGKDGFGASGSSNYSEIRKFARLSEEHPIPMYGIQAFAPIEGWVKGTPFNLSQIAKGQVQAGEEKAYDFKSISLLRSVVKLELVLPYDKTNAANNPIFVVLFYPNIYARCEPMDVWTPTDLLWKNNVHYAANEANKWDSEKDCEWQAIRNYGPVSQDDITGNKYDTDDKKLAESREQYPIRMAWFYGAWYEYSKLHGGRFWNFNGNTDVTKKLDTYLANKDINSDDYVSPFPHIFNSCIQRNSQVYCDESFVGSDNKLHYVVYTGERNINDPTDLTKIDEQGSGKGTVCYWVVQIGDWRYGIVVADPNEYSGSDLFSETSNSKTGYQYRKEAKVNANEAQTVDFPYPKLSNRMQDYETAVQKYDNTRQTQSPNVASNMPWPLLRNHVYTITINSIATRADGGGELSISAKESHSESINFDKPRKETKEKEKVTEKK